LTHHGRSGDLAVDADPELCASVARFSLVYPTAMHQILETEAHVQVPPMMYSDPFYRITCLIKEEIRKHKWIEAEKGRALSWEQACQEWTDAHREKFEKFLFDTLSIPEAMPEEEQPAEEERCVSVTAKRLSTIPYRPVG
jgi:hypothetical protein